jgi:iron complex transport system substrate-binding protein
VLNQVRNFPPERIICLTEETVETLYLLGEQDRIVGVTGYAVRPPIVRKERERVASFTSAKIDKIISLKPDLVLAFSDLQAGIAADLIKNGIAVMTYNHRDISGILAMIRHLGAAVGAGEKAEDLASSYERRLLDYRNNKKAAARPLVYFEEWDSPMITGIKWVSELIEIAGGVDVFSELSSNQDATNRVVTSQQVIKAAPDVIVASWCGKKVRHSVFMERDGWSVVPAVANNRIYEIKSPLILQPGPAALTEGLDKLVKILSTVDNNKIRRIESF